MSKIIIISNRLPVTVKKIDGKLEYHFSIGGLATGIKSYHERTDSIWIGWPGIADEDISEKEKKIIAKKLRQDYNCIPVFLTGEEVEQYYNGFCNKTIWPLFHYFTEKAKYEIETWETYQRVNEKFFKSAVPMIKGDNIIWVHDYQLMLLPKLIKDNFPDTQVGFFLHIPFPSFEIFRLLIWREEILHGLLGADLVGFHTYEYVRHFMSTTSRLLSLDNTMHRISYEARYVQVDAFPMGIDYEFFSREFVEDPAQKEEIEKILDETNGMKMILSIDRLDYTKGIPERLEAFRRFLAQNPEYIEKVRLHLILAPSREAVDTYSQLLKEIKESISEINGEFGTFTWMPVWFFFRNFSQESLITLYRHSDVMLVTPLRDGMNLVCKEYIASRTDYEGMLVISETAGAASELGEAVVVNPNDCNAIARGIKNALDMPYDEKVTRNKMMHSRLKRYNVHFWADEFISALQRVVTESKKTITQKNIEKDSRQLELSYKKSAKRLLFLDYDGTLVGFKTTPEQAKPDEELKSLLFALAGNPRNTVVLISGRERHNLDEWFGDLNMHLIAAHGLWIRHPGQEWSMTVSLDNSWKESVRHTLQSFTDRVPGSLIEEKDYSLAWHYRHCDPDIISLKLTEVKMTLLSMTQSVNLTLQEGNKVLEVKDSRFDKGFGASILVQNSDYDFLFAAGDDYTDEDLFLSLPCEAFTVKIGMGNTNAQYYLKSWQSMRSILRKFTAIDCIEAPEQIENPAIGHA